MPEEYLNNNFDDIHNGNELADHEVQNAQDRHNGRVVRQKIVQQYFR